MIVQVLDRSVRIELRPPFEEVNRRLVPLLQSLRPDEWLLPTVHPGRTVKDLVAHLVDGSLRRLSAQRDGFVASRPNDLSMEGLVAFIQAMNREWMSAARRLSPRILIDLAHRYDQELLELLYSKDLGSTAHYPVTWAGESESAHWFDVAREYTEKWHHQQQIRDAVGREPLYEEALLGPVLDTFARGLPHAARDLDASPGCVVAIEIRGHVDRDWILVKAEDGWRLSVGMEATPAAELSVSADEAWRLWTKAFSGKNKARTLAVRGRAGLVEPLIAYCAIMA